MKAILLVLLLATPTYAQTVCRVEPLHDDCPPGAVRNPPVSPLDEAYMEAAVRASFRGLFGREPSMVDGAGKDDGCYYVRASNHYGPTGDGQCHAGWSGYWESWLENGRGDIALVQTPARFLPTIVVPPTPIPTPPPVPAPFCDVSGLAQQIDALGRALAAHDGKQDQHAQNVEQFQEDVRGWKGTLAVFAARYILPLVGTYEVCRVSGKCQ